MNTEGEGYQPESGIDKSIEIEEIRKELEEHKKLSEEYLNKLKYLQADFDNYRKHVSKEAERNKKLANIEIITDLLPFADALDSAIENETEEKALDGLKSLHNSFFEILKRHGLKRIETIGKRLDVRYHEAVMSCEGDEDEIIIEDVQPGYIIGNDIIRYSKVKISRKKGDDDNV